MRKINILFLLIISSFISSCVDIIDFETNNTNGEFPLIVEGGITLGEGPYYLKLTRFTGDQAILIDNAEIYLLSDKGEKEVFSSLGDGNYIALGENMLGESGVGYQIEILLNSQRYLSRLEIMPEIAKINDFSFEMIDREFAVTGGILVKKYMDISINASLPKTESNSFIRWRIKEDWRMTETQSPSPLAIPRTCYFTQRHEPQLVKLFDGSKVKVKELEQYKLINRIVDWAFAEKIQFTIYQSSITENAFQYWRDVNLIVNQSGSIFDAPPAALPGNIYNTNDTTELVLGYFEAIANDTLRVPIFKFDLAPFRIVPRCRVSWQDYRFGERTPLECYDCSRINGASLLRPDDF